METILIVDDEKNTLKMLSQGLKMRGYQALTAASGEEALQQCVKSDVDLVLLDIRMENGMDGVQTLVKLRERYPKLNVVIMSAQQDIEIAVNTMANLFVPYYTTKAESDGTGLGVPIVRRIVTEHGAEINFQSTEGVGTTVRIHFPHNQGTPSEEFASAAEDLTPHTDLVPEFEIGEQVIDTKD